MCATHTHTHTDSLTHEVHSSTPTLGWTQVWEEAKEAAAEAREKVLHAQEQYQVAHFSLFPPPPHPIAQKRDAACDEEEEGLAKQQEALVMHPYDAHELHASS